MNITPEAYPGDDDVIEVAPGEYELKIITQLKTENEELTEHTNKIEATLTSLYSEVCQLESINADLVEATAAYLSQSSVSNRRRLREVIAKAQEA